MRPLSLTAETQAILTRIRTHGWTLSVLGMSQASAWRLVRARIQRRAMAAGVTVMNVNIYRRYVHELVKAFRTETGERLARAVELAIRKWVNLGLKCELLQGLLGDCFRRFEQHGYAEPTVAPPAVGRKRGPKARLPGRGQARHLPRRFYEKALGKGRTSRARHGMIQDQVARQKAGSAQAAEIAARLRPVLAARSIPGAQFVAYFSFAQKLGRLCRNYAAKSLAIAAADLIDRYEAKSLNRDALRAIAVILFGLTDLD
jgi:hypothetical protein